MSESVLSTQRLIRYSLHLLHVILAPFHSVQQDFLEAVVSVYRVLIQLLIINKMDYRVKGLNAKGSCSQERSFSTTIIKKPVY